MHFNTSSAKYRPYCLDIQTLLATPNHENDICSSLRKIAALPNETNLNSYHNNT